MAETPREKWLRQLAAMEQGDKNNSLFICIDNLCYEQTEDLIKAGAQTKYPQSAENDILAWGMRRTDDVRMTLLLLDMGLTAEQVAFKDVVGFLKDDLQSGLVLLRRLTLAGLPMMERAKAVAYGAENKHIGIIEASLLPEEDAVSLFNAAQKLDPGSALQAPEVAQKIKQICEQAAEREENLYATHFPGGTISLEKLSAAVTKGGLTGLMLAVITGHIEQVLDYFRSHPEVELPSEILLRTDRFQQSAISLLWHRRQLDKVLDPDIWYSRMSAQKALWNSIPEMYRTQIDFDAISTATRQVKLKKTVVKHTFRNPEK